MLSLPPPRVRSRKNIASLNGCDPFKHLRVAEPARWLRAVPEPNPAIRVGVWRKQVNRKPKIAGKSAPCEAGLKASSFHAHWHYTTYLPECTAIGECHKENPSRTNLLSAPSAAWCYHHLLCRKSTNLKTETSAPLFDTTSRNAIAQSLQGVVYTSGNFKQLSYQIFLQMALVPATSWLQKSCNK